MWDLKRMRPHCRTSINNKRGWGYQYRGYRRIGQITRSYTLNLCFTEAEVEIKKNICVCKNVKAWDNGYWLHFCHKTQQAKEENNAYILFCFTVFTKRLSDGQTASETHFIQLIISVTFQSWQIWQAHPLQATIGQVRRQKVFRIWTTLSSCLFQSSHNYFHRHCDASPTVLQAVLANLSGQLADTGGLIKLTWVLGLWKLAQVFTPPSPFLQLTSTWRHLLCFCTAAPPQRTCHTSMHCLRCWYCWFPHLMVHLCRP